MVISSRRCLVGIVMRPRIFALIGGLLSLLGCIDPNRPIETSAGNLTQPQVDEITDKCGAPRGTARIQGNRLVVLQLKDMAISACVLKALHATGETTLSSVGNQRYDTPGGTDAPGK